MDLAMAVLGYAIAWASFGFLHSLLARPAVKARFRGALRRGYRLAYNALASGHLLAVLAVGGWLFAGSGPFALPGWANTMRLLALAVGAAILVAGARRYDLRRLAGLAQWRGRADDPDLDDEPLHIDGIHRYVRHPLYLGVLLVAWGLASSALGLATAAFATIYTLIGIRHEERDLVRRFGDAYREYQRRVPSLLPWPGRSMPIAWSPGSRR